MSQITEAEIITIDEAIKHSYEVAGRKCDDCGKEHLQLAKWLEELKKNRDIITCQKAKIAELEAEVERLQKAGEEAITCFNRMESLYKIKCKELEVAKSEAYREFASKLKYERFNQLGICTVNSVVDKIEYTLKELTEKNDFKLEVENENLSHFSEKGNQK